jgi:outer membrane lipoprotein carrier protein
MSMISAFLVAGPAFSSEMTIDEILDRMEKADAGIKNVQFEFTQEIVYPLTKEKQTNSGEVIFQKPNNLYLKQKNPLEQIIVSNGKKVWIYTPAYHQAVVDSWKKWTSSSMVPASVLNFGQSVPELKKRYTFTYKGLEDADYVILLTPKAKDSWQLTFWINSESFIPAKVSLSGDNVTVTTETRNYKLNPAVDKKIFSFKAPAGVEVLNLP